MSVKRIVFGLLLWVGLSAPAYAQLVLPSPQSISAVSSAITDCTSVNCATWSLANVTPSFTSQITGTLTSLTLTAEGTADGQTWFTVYVKKLGSGAWVTTTTGTGQFAIANTGLVGFRWRCTTYSSGGANVTLTRGAATSAADFSPTFPATFTAGDLLYASDATTISGITAVASGQVLASAGTSTAPAYTANPSVTTATVTRDNITTTSTDGFIATNTTAATGAVTVQMSPRSRWRGTAWDTAASQTVDFFAETLPATAATPTGTWRLGYSRNGTAAVFPLLVTSAGGITGLSGGFIVSGGAVFSAAGSGFIHNGRTSLSAITDGTENITNNAGTAGFGLDGNSDAVMKVRVRAQNAYGTVDALAYQASGTPITSGTTHLSAGSGMAVANVGANSCGTTTATIAGNNNTFEITVGATAGTQCRVAFTFAAATKWNCSANDSTTTVAVRTTPVDTTHTDFIGTFTAGDVVTGICFPR